MVSHTFASWNQMPAWLRRLEGLGAQPEVNLPKLPFRPDPGIQKCHG